MQTQVSLRHVPTADARAAVARLRENADHALARFGRRVRAAEVTVRDGGDKTGGAGLRCTVRVALSRGKAVVAKATGATPAAAAGEALRTARRLVADRLESVAARRHGRRKFRRAAA